MLIHASFSCVLDECLTLAAMVMSAELVVPSAFSFVRCVYMQHFSQTVVAAHKGSFYRLDFVYGAPEPVAIFLPLGHRL